MGERTLKRGGANITARAGGGQSGSPEKGQCCPQSRGRYGAVPKSRSSCDSQVASPLLSGSTIATSWALLLRHNQQSVGSSWMRPSPGLSHLATHSPSRSSLVSQLGHFPIPDWGPALYRHRRLGTQVPGSLPQGHSCSPETGHLEPSSQHN